MSETVDYLVLGSGLSALTFSALSARRGKSVRILEAHEHIGGYGHTFTFGDFSFNAQLHYAFSCGEGEPVRRFLRDLGLEEEVRFNLLNPDGFDRVFCEGRQLNIPYGLDPLRRNLEEVCPESKRSIQTFIDVLRDFREVTRHLPASGAGWLRLAGSAGAASRLLRFRHATLQEVFDHCGLPKLLQTLVSGQLIDVMLPPKDLSFMVWAALFTAYNRGAYFPEKQFGFYVDQVAESITRSGGTFHLNEQVISFIRRGGRVVGARTRSVDPKLGIPYGPEKEWYGKEIICNIDPKVAAEMIGLENFSSSVRRRLAYDYSYSSFALYGVVEGIELADHGFGDWNIWHCQPDHNRAFHEMYDLSNYERPYFGMNCRSLHTDDTSNCRREGCQIFQMLTVANYDHWKTLRINDHRAYHKKKREVLNHLLDVVEEHYVPSIRDHLVFKMTGSPTTNERYAWAPKGGSYGVNLTVENFRLGTKLGYESSVPGLYFCSAAAGLGGFGGTAMTGIRLFEALSGERLG